MKAQETTTHTHGLQDHHPGYCPPGAHPLRGAMIATASQKLYLRRLRGGLTGALETAAVTRLLDVSDSVFRALQRLQGRSRPTDDKGVDIDQPATDSWAARAVDGVAQ